MSFEVGRGKVNAMDYRELSIVGAVRIFPELSLADTAMKIGVALGGVLFKQDPPGVCDEFPSFSAEVAGLSFVLLGIPDASEQITSIEEYTLQIGKAYLSDKANEICDASGYFTDLLKTRSELRIKG